jgi:hypothetical protein
VEAGGGGSESGGARGRRAAGRPRRETLTCRAALQVPPKCARLVGKQHGGEAHGAGPAVEVASRRDGGGVGVENVGDLRRGRRAGRSPAAAAGAAARPPPRPQPPSPPSPAPPILRDRLAQQRRARDHDAVGQNQQLRGQRGEARGAEARLEARALPQQAGEVVIALGGREGVEGGLGGLRGAGGTGV